MVLQTEVDRLAVAAEALGLHDAELPKEYSYASVSLCVLDAVFSIGVHYRSVEKVIERYCARYKLQPYQDDAAGRPARSEQEPLGLLLRRIADMGPERFASEVVANRQRTSTRNGILKSEAALRFGRALARHGVEYLQDVHRVAESQQLRAEILAIPGQRSGVSLQYFWMLVGADDLIKPDRMILRYLKAVLGRPTSVLEAQELVARTAQALQREHPHLTPKLLDYKIWKYQRSARAGAAPLH